MVTMYTKLFVRCFPLHKSRDKCSDRSGSLLQIWSHIYINVITEQN